jgi:hypothetical protein
VTESSAGLVVTAVPTVGNWRWFWDKFSLCSTELGKAVRLFRCEADFRWDIDAFTVRRQTFAKTLR